MNELEIETEIVQISSYCEIICCILKTHRILSINNVIFFSYLIKQKKFTFKEVYSGNTKRDVIFKCISLLSGEFEDYCNSISFIIKSIHLLILNDKIKLSNGLLILNNEEGNVSRIYELNIFINKAIEESRNLTEKQFMREVMRCV